MKFDISKVQFEHPENWDGWSGYFSDSVTTLRDKVETEDTKYLCKASGDAYYPFKATTKDWEENYVLFYPIDEPTKKLESLPIMGTVMHCARENLYAMVIARTPKEVLLACYDNWLTVRELEERGWE